MPTNHSLSEVDQTFLNRRGEVRRVIALQLLHHRSSSVWVCRMHEDRDDAQRRSGNCTLNKPLHHRHDRVIPAEIVIQPKLVDYAVFKKESTKYSQALFGGLGVQRVATVCKSPKVINYNDGAHRRNSNIGKAEQYDMIQVVMNTPIREAFEELLASRRLHLAGPLPDMPEDDLPCFIVGIDQDLWDEVVAKEENKS